MNLVTIYDGRQGFNIHDIGNLKLCEWKDSEREISRGSLMLLAYTTNKYDSASLKSLPLNIQWTVPTSTLKD